jgi:translation elongation factor EF-Tu-like GTPase
MRTYLHIQVVFFSPEEGGRQHLPVLRGYRPHLVVPPSTEMLGIEFVDGPTNYQPDEEIHAVVKCLYQPLVSNASLTAGIRFKILEGGKVVGSGKVVDE